MISVTTRYIAPAEATQRALGVQVTRLVDSYMVWVGETDESAETVENAPRRGSLCKDWACAMPEGSATTVYRTGGSDVACGMAQRLARRVGKPVFLSVDVGAGMVLAAEMGVLATLLEG